MIIIVMTTKTNIITFRFFYYKITELLIIFIRVNRKKRRCVSLQNGKTPWRTIKINIYNIMIISIIVLNSLRLKALFVVP